MKKQYKILILLGTFILIIFGGTYLLYNKVFNMRYEFTDKPLRLTLEDFPLLQGQAVSFSSGKETLRGNFYTYAQTNFREKELIIFCHGISNGSSDYLSQIDFFASQGYEILAYDNTGCHNSTGKAIKGLPQAAIDLHNVLIQLQQNPEFSAYHTRPLILMGHSWGAYGVNAVLNFEDVKNVKGVVSFSGFNKSLDMLLSQGKHLLGNSIQLFKPFLQFCDYLRFGKYSFYSAIDGINKSDAIILAFHSLDDPIVDFEYSVVAQQLQCTNPNATFVTVKNAGHNILLSPASRLYAQQLAESAIAFETDKDAIAKIDKFSLYQLDKEVLTTVLDFISNLS